MTRSRIIVGFIDSNEATLFEIGTGKDKKALTGKELIDVLREVAESGGYELEYKKKGGQGG